MEPSLLIVLLGTLTITSYRAVPQQTKATCLDRWHCTTATGDTPSEQGLAVSQDLLASGEVHYGDIVCVDGYGCRIVNDCLNKRHKKAIDLFVYTYAEEKKVNTQHRKTWVIRQRRIT